MAFSSYRIQHQHVRCSPPNPPKGSLLNSFIPLHGGRSSCRGNNPFRHGAMARRFLVIAGKHAGINKLIRSNKRSKRPSSIKPHSKPRQGPTSDNRVVLTSGTSSNRETLLTISTKQEKERYDDDVGQEEEEEQQQEDKKGCHTDNDDIILADHHWYHIYIQC